MNFTIWVLETRIRFPQRSKLGIGDMLDAVLELFDLEKLKKKRMTDLRLPSSANQMPESLL